MASNLSERGDDFFVTGEGRNDLLEVAEFNPVAVVHVVNAELEVKADLLLGLKSVELEKLGETLFVVFEQSRDFLAIKEFYDLLVLLLLFVAVC